MTAPRLDLGELRAKCDNAEDSWSVIDIECSDLEHLLGIAGAAEAYVSMVEQMPDASLGHQGTLSKVMGGYNALRAALAAVRKEEKGE